MNAYFISGLGADRRAFKHIRLPHTFNIIHLDWLEPIVNETLKDYAKRMAGGIDQSREFILVGLSFGGMLVTEISKITQPKKSILISSATLAKQIPWYYRVIAKLRLLNLVPFSLLKKPGKLSYWAFGTKTESDQQLIQQILNDTSTRFLKWALKAIFSWTNEQRPENLIHIHGTADIILPYRFVKADYTINGGGHFMLHNRAEKVNKILALELN